MQSEIRTDLVAKIALLITKDMEGVDAEIIPSRYFDLADQILALFPPTLTEEEIEEKIKSVLLPKTEIFLNCAKDCQKHNCWSGMDTLLSFTSEEISKSLSGKIAKEPEVYPEDFKCGGCGVCEACKLWEKEHNFFPNKPLSQPPEKEIVLHY